MDRSTYTDALGVLLCSINKRGIIKKKKQQLKKTKTFLLPTRNIKHWSAHQYFLKFCT